MKEDNTSVTQISSHLSAAEKVKRLPYRQRQQIQAEEKRLGRMLTPDECLFVCRESIEDILGNSESLDQLMQFLKTQTEQLRIAIINAEFIRGRRLTKDEYFDLVAFTILGKNAKKDDEGFKLIRDLMIDLHHIHSST